MKKNINIERSDYVLGAEVMSLCMKNSYNLSNLTLKVYGNCHSKNMVRVYMCLEAFMKYGIIIPKFNHNILLFTYNNGSVE